MKIKKEFNNIEFIEKSLKSNVPLYKLKMLYKFWIIIKPQITGIMDITDVSLGLSLFVDTMSFINIWN